MCAFLPFGATNYNCAPFFHRISPFFGTHGNVTEGALGTKRALVVTLHTRIFLGISFIDLHRANTVRDSIHHKGGKDGVARKVCCARL